MRKEIENLVFAGGGVLGISYIGVLKYLYENDLMRHVKRIAGTSAGAITACLTSFDLDFDQLLEMVNTLNYDKVPKKRGNTFFDVSEEFKETMEDKFGSIECINRLLTKYGWYSSEYFYEWISTIINNQFDQSLKKPPYSFSDFKNNDIHINKKPFLDLYITGTNVSTRTSYIFSFDSTPDMEVAQAVRISMSIPLFFETIDIDDYAITKNNELNLFNDGGVMNNYPINLFDHIIIDGKKYTQFNYHTLGAKFLSLPKYHKINNFIDYLNSFFMTILNVQNLYFYMDPLDIERTIMIDHGNVLPTEFNIKVGDNRYNDLIEKGYDATKQYFEGYKV